MERSASAVASFVAVFTRHYTEVHAKIGLWLRRRATACEPVCIAQQLQVVLLRRQLKRIPKLTEA